MKTKVSWVYRSRLIIQRNLMLLVSLFLLIAVVLQAILLFLKDEKVILLPPDIRRELWVSNREASREYFEDMADWFCYLMLTKNPKTVDHNHGKLLKYVSQEHYQSFLEQLVAEENRYKKDGISTNFVWSEKETYMLTNSTVFLSGDLVTQIGSQVVDTSRKRFRVHFVREKGRWLLAEFKEISQESKEENK